jgi:hypothetical protein
MTNKQRRSFQDLPIANISLKQFDAETKNFAPEPQAKEITEPVVTAEPAQVPPAAVVVSAPALPAKDTKRLTIDLDDTLNYKFSQYALDQGKKKTEIIREWIMAAIAAR